MSDSQTLETLELIYKPKHAPCATRNGNNAAWLCWCGHHAPLLGTGLPGVREKPVRCLKCGSEYRVEFGKDENGKDKPKRVVEI